MSLLNIPGETKVEKLIAIILIICLMGALAHSTQKPAHTSIFLEFPVETPNGVQFSWQGGDPELRYSIYRRMVGAENWERIELNLPHQGTYFAEGFTLDHDYEYQMRADF